MFQMREAFRSNQPAVLLELCDIMTTSLVTPGEIIGNASELTSGAGTTEQNGKIVAIFTGNLAIDSGVATVTPAKRILAPSVGDIVIATVTKVQEKSAEVRILQYLDKTGDIPAEYLFAQLRVTEVVDRFLHNLSDGLKLRDVVRAEITDIDPTIRISLRSKEECGVISAICSNCGGNLSIDVEGDFNLKCETDGTRFFRAISSDFGNYGHEYTGETKEITLAGKRWDRSTEANFAKGPAARAAWPAGDIRNDGRQKNMFRFEGEGNQGQRRRNSHAPGSKLFIGGLPYEVSTDDLKEMMEKQGSVQDCVVVKDDEGKSRGFGFVTFSSKEEAQSAISKYDGYRIKGRRISVKDADNKGEKKEKKADPAGQKLYVGNLSFKLTNDDLIKHFSTFGNATGGFIVTDPRGKSKGFGFVFVDEKEGIEEIIAKANGSELGGRNIKVDKASEGKSKSPNNKSKNKKKLSREEMAKKEEGYE